MMFGKKLSFMLIPGSRDKMRQFNISYILIISCLAVVVLMFVANVFLTSSFFQSKADANRISFLEAENRILLNKYEELNEQVKEIGSLYQDLVSKEIVIRNIFNLPEISLDERQLGIGGPERATDRNLSEAIQMAQRTQAEIDDLVRLARFENEKYEEVYDILAEKKSILDHTPSILPTQGLRSRGFGMKYDPFTGYQRFHHGLDISNRTGTPIYAPADGVVKFAGLAGELGKMITIDHGYRLETRYGHLSQFKVRPGTKVRRGDLIGLLGSTGYSTGPHLHYEVVKNDQRVNPMEFIINK